MTREATTRSSVPDAAALARSPQLACLSALHHQLALVRLVLTVTHGGDSDTSRSNDGLLDQGRSLVKVAMTLEHQIVAYRCLLEDAATPAATSAPTGSSRGRSASRS